MKIKVRLINPNCKFEFIDKGEWIDLKAARTVEFSAPYANTLNGSRTKRDVVFDYKHIPLGFAMKLPKGFEAVALPRSSTFKHWGLLLANSKGVIDSSFSGTNDEWQFLALATRDATEIEFVSLEFNLVRKHLFGLKSNGCLLIRLNLYG